MSKVREFLEGMAPMMANANRAMSEWKYKSFHELVLAEGVEFAPPSRPLPESIPAGVIKECFSNCWSLIASHEHESLTYVEGYALGENGIMPVMHAWLVTPEGEVIDPTWCGGGNPEAGVEYIGLPFKKTFAIETVLEAEHYGVIDNYMSKENKWPLLRGIHPVEWKEEVAHGVS